MTLRSATAVVLAFSQVALSSDNSRRRCRRVSFAPRNRTSSARLLRLRKLPRHSLRRKLQLSREQPAAKPQAHSAGELLRPLRLRLQAG